MKYFLKKHLNWVVFTGFLVTSLLVTLPFILNPFNTLVSPIDGDAGYSSILFEAIKRENLNPFTDGIAESVAYPDGITNNTGVNRVSFFSTILLWFGTLLTSAFFIHSLVAITGTLLSGFISYLFIRKVTESTFASVTAGLTIMFMPTMLTILFSSSPYTHMWIYVAVLWLFWFLATSPPSIKKFLISFGLIFLTLFWTPYYSFHVLMIAGLCAGVVTIIYWQKYAWKKACLFAGASIMTLLCFAVIYYVIGTTSQYSSIPSRSLEEIYEQSSHPLMYIIPSFFSTFGHGIHDFFATLIPRIAGSSLYLGVTILIIAGFVLTYLRKPSSHDVKTRYAVILALVIFVSSFLFSLAPTVAVLGVNIPTPSYLIAEFVPSLRAGQRLAMPMIASLIILFGVGLSVIQTKLPKKYAAWILSVIVLIVAIDIASLPVARYTTTESREVFTELSQQEKGLAAVYLHDSLVSNPGQYVCYPQFNHEMWLINDCGIQRDPYNFDVPKKTLAGIISQPLCQQITTLRTMNVKYLIVAIDDNDDVNRCIKSDRSNSLILSDDRYEVYRITNP